MVYLYPITESTFMSEKIILCPNCQNRKAVLYPNLGPTECSECKSKSVKPRAGPEFTSDDIREQRREYAKDILAPRRDGVLSKEYLREYGTAGIVATPEEIKNARNVWGDIKGKWNRDRSKGG